MTDSSSVGQIKVIPGQERPVDERNISLVNCVPFNNSNKRPEPRRRKIANSDILSCSEVCKAQSYSVWVLLRLLFREVVKFPWKLWICKQSMLNALLREQLKQKTELIATFEKQHKEVIGSIQKLEQQRETDRTLHAEERKTDRKLHEEERETDRKLHKEERETDRKLHEEERETDRKLQEKEREEIKRSQKELNSNMRLLMGQFPQQNMNQPQVQMSDTPSNTNPPQRGTRVTPSNTNQHATGQPGTQLSRGTRQNRRDHYRPNKRT
ncbi:unnamed protein product [Mytilus edulis]|uniref:Uncharacterized protein n=1 Tax=Mytilus edulis TaxID=6550 RepID=A0A8S3R7B1_MYTED|nr:unnamed protein product [Mytilus edulis]